MAAAIVLLFTTVTLAGPCHPQTQAAPVIKAVTARPVAARPTVIKSVAAIAHAVAQAASAPRKVPRVRAAMAQALLRLPTTPLAFLVLFLVTCIAVVPVSKRACAVADRSRLPSHGHYRALLQVFLI